MKRPRSSYLVKNFELGYGMNIHHRRQTFILPTFFFNKFPELKKPPIASKAKEMRPDMYLQRHFHALHIRFLFQSCQQVELIAHRDSFPCNCPGGRPHRFWLERQSGLVMVATRGQWSMKTTFAVRKRTVCSSSLEKRKKKQNKTKPA